MTSLTQHPLSAAFPTMLAEEFQGLRDMRAMAKRRSPRCSEATPEIGTCANPETPEVGTSYKIAPAEIGTSAKKHAKEQVAAQARQVAEDAHSESDTIAMLDASETENAELRVLLATAQADDQKAETLKWRHIALVFIGALRLGQGQVVFVSGA